MKSFCLRALGLFFVLGLMQSTSLQAQHLSLTTHTNYVPRVIDLSSENLSGQDLQTLGLDLRLFRNEKWAFRMGVVIQGQQVYNAFSDDYYYSDGRHDDFDRDGIDDWRDQFSDLDDGDWDDWDDHYYDCPEFDYERFAEDFDLMAEIGIERHFFMLDKKLDIYPGVYLPINIGPQTDFRTALSTDEMLSNAGAVLGANVRLLRVFRLGIELDAGFQQASNGISESFRSGNIEPFKAIPYQTSITFGMAF
ncbi:MAG: hypothetical protein AAFN10_10745 [Bacteroidota bacterium]